MDCLRRMEQYNVTSCMTEANIIVKHSDVGQCGCDVDCVEAQMVCDSMNWTRGADGGTL